jgi:hypothetical protein
VPLFCRQAGMAFFARHVEPIDISLGGLRIHSDEAHPIGSFLPLDIFFPNVPPVTLSARVMWVTLLGKGAPARFEAGLAFVELTPYALKLLRSAIGSEGSVEFISDEPATELHAVAPLRLPAPQGPDIHSMLSETPVVLVSAETLRAAQLDGRAGFLVSLIDGTTTVESLLDLSGMPEQETLALLDDLRSRGIVGFGESDQPNPWVPPRASVRPRLETLPPSSNAPTARSLRTGSLEPEAPDVAAVGVASGFRRRVPGAKRQWLLAVATLVLVGGIAAGVVVLPHHLHTLPALATAARSVPGPEPQGPTILPASAAEQALPVPSAALPPRVSAAPAAASVSAPPAAPRVSAPPAAPRVSAPPAAASVSAPPAAASVSAPPVAASASAPPSDPIPPRSSVAPSFAVPSKPIDPMKGLVETPQSKGHRIYVDGVLVGETPTPVLVSCGMHIVKVGSAGGEQLIDVPCGGVVTVAP